eukprot:COSAG06_NODE_906_length_11624_cov_6.452321_9_plen_520_part_00
MQQACEAGVGRRTTSSAQSEGCDRVATAGVQSPRDPAAMGRAGWLAYTTPKLVTIEEPKLGAMHYTFLFCIGVLYVGVYALLINGGYMLHEPPIGTVKMSLQGPHPNSGPTACEPGPKDPACNYTFADTRDLAYCSKDPSAKECDKKQKLAPSKGRAAATVGRKPRQLSEGDSALGAAARPPSPPTPDAPPDVCPCRIQDELQAVYPVTGDSPFFITTRVMEAHQHVNGACGLHNTTCPQPYVTDIETRSYYFVADIENFTLMIDHAAYSPSGAKVCRSDKCKSFLGSGSAAMNWNDKAQKFTAGRLKYGENDEKEIVPRRTPTMLDYFTIAELLQATRKAKENGPTWGVSLDEPSDVVDKDGHSIRHEGMVLLLKIYYSNFIPGSSYFFLEDTIQYYYTAQMLSGTESKVLEQQPSAVGDRIYRDRHGIKIVVLQAGQLSSYSLQAFVTTMTSSLFLIALSTTFVDCEYRSERGCAARHLLLLPHHYRVPFTLVCVCVSIYVYLALSFNLSLCVLQTQ